MIRIARDSVTSTTTATTMSTIREAKAVLSSFAYQRRGALDLQHLDPRPGFEGLVLVERAGAPDLAADLDLAAAAVHPLQHHGRGAHQRRGAGAKLHRRAEMAAGDRPQHRDRGGRDSDEHDPLERHTAAGQRDDRR